MKKYNVLIYGMTYNYGGVESVIMNYYRNMNKDKLHFDFMCVNDQMAYEDEVKANNSIVYKIGSKAKNFIEYKKNIKKFFKDNSKEYDAIWFNVCTLVNIDALKLAKKYGIATRIVHSHNSNMDYGFVKNSIHKFNKLRLRNYANVYWACSDVAAEYLFGDNKNYKVINNAINVDEFCYCANLRKNVRDTLHINDSTLVIGNVGRFDEQKNHKFLIDIFNEIYKENNDSMLMLVGTGPLEDEIKNKVKELGIENNILFLGKRNDVNSLYQAMDVFCLPSLYEGLPVVGIEAQASGLLCFFSDTITNKLKIIETSKFESIEERPQKWCKSITKALVDFVRKNVKEEIIENGYDIKKEASSLEKVFEEIIIDGRKKQ